MAQSPLYGSQNRRSEYRDRLAAQLIGQGSDSSPVQHWSQGAARLAQALAGGLIGMKQDQRADERQKAYTTTMQGAMSAQDPQAMIAALSGNQDTAPQALAMQQQLMSQRQADQARQNDPMYGRTNVRGVGLVDMRGGQPNVVVPEQRAPQAEPQGVAEYNFAKSQGFTGSYLDFQTAKASAGRQPEKPQAQARPMTPEERTSFGVPESVPAYMGPDGKPSTLSVPRQEAVWQIDPKDPLIQVNVATGERKPMPGAEKAQAKQDQAETALNDTERMITSARDLLNHPGRQAATGMSSMFNVMPGTQAYGFKAKLDTLKAQVFLPEVQKMVGMGALSNAEGEKISSAFAALDPGMPEAEFQKSLADAIGRMEEAKTRFAQRAGRASPGASQPPAQAAAPASGGGIKFLGFEGSP